jgi:hypothetical protein
LSSSIYFRNGIDYHHHGLCASEFVQRCFDRFFFRRRNFITIFLQLFFGLEDQAICQFILSTFSRATIRSLVGFCFCLHLIHFFLTQSTTCFDTYLCSFPVPLSFWQKNSVCVDVKYHFDLRNSSWSRRYTIEVKHAKTFVLARHQAFTLQYLNLYTRLIVARR